MSIWSPCSSRGRLLAAGTAAVMFLVAARPARAALGETRASIAIDRAALAAAHGGTIDRGRYSVETLTSGGSAVREYLSPAGVVFGVAWNGVAHPDLAPLLGSYAKKYAAALEATPRVKGRRHHQVRAEDLVVERWGHMRDLHGRAYAPALLPSGVRVDEIE